MLIASSTTVFLEISPVWLNMLRPVAREGLISKRGLIWDGLRF